MGPALSENIRNLRKQKGLTQQQLAEALDVTAGAVHKWETGMSYPEIYTLVEIADYFDTSVDYLLGYEIKGSNLETSLTRIAAMLRNNDPDILYETERFLKKYPNSFKAVLVCALACLTIGAERHDNEILKHSLNLFDRSLDLIGQNDDPTVSAAQIYGNIGAAHIALGEYEKGLAILKEHNLSGMYNRDIGLTLSGLMKRPEEAQSYITESIIDHFFGLFDSIIAQASIHDQNKDYAKEKEILNWGLTLMSGMAGVGNTGYLNKLHAILLIMMAHVQLKTGENDKAQATVRQAYVHVRNFDTSPDYGLGSLHLTKAPEEASIHDFLGVTAQESVETMCRILEDEKLLAIWKETVQ